MTRTRLSDLSIVTETMFQKKYQLLHPVLKAEAHIQQQLARLDSQVEQVRRASSQTEGYRVTGTDVLWNGWESSTRRQLNTELARARAQKLAALEELRRVFGRKQAIENLISDLRAERRRNEGRRQSSP